MRLPLQKALQRYVRDLLGLDLQLLDFDAANIPFFLRERYSLAEALIAGKRTLVFAAKESGGEPSANVIQKDSEKLQSLTQLLPVWVVPRITAYDRRRLIDRRICFIVPGSQAFLPCLLIDLQEQFRLPPSKRSSLHLSPSTQAVFLNLIYARAQHLEGTTASRIFAGYSKMTLSRAITELEEYELIQTHSEGRNRRGTVSLPWRELWTKALPHLRSPVRRKIFVSAEELALGPMPFLAGVSALASFSFLSAPLRPVYAYFPVRGAPCPRFRHPVRAADDAAAEVELWSYAPLPDSLPKPVVDRLSLYLSLKDDPNERVQGALEAMMQGVF